MVSTRAFISNSSSPFANPLVTVPSAAITTSIAVTLMFPSFFNSLARSRYLYSFLLSNNLTLWSAWTAKSIIIIISLLLTSFSLKRQLEVFCWRQVSSSLQDTSLYPGRSQPCCNLWGYDFTTHFQLSQIPFQTFDDRCKRTY